MEYQPVYIDPEKAVRLGLKHRLEICEKEIDIELANINIKKEKLDGQITGSVSAYYDLIGVGEDNLNIGMSNTYQDAINHLKSKQGGIKEFPLISQFRFGIGVLQNPIYECHNIH